MMTKGKFIQGAMSFILRLCFTSPQFMKFSLVLFDYHVETHEGINKQTKTLKMCLHLDRRITEWKDVRTCMAATRLSFLVWQQMMYFSLFHSHFMEQRFLCYSSVQLHA